RPDDLFTRLAFASVVLPVTLAVVAALAPPTAKDTLQYHIALPKAWLAVGALVDVPYNIPGLRALGAEMSGVWGMLLGRLLSPRAGEAAFGAAMFAYFPLLLAVVHGWARERGLGRGATRHRRRRRARPRSPDRKPVVSPHVAPHRQPALPVLPWVVAGRGTRLGRDARRPVPGLQRPVRRRPQGPARLPAAAGAARADGAAGRAAGMGERLRSRVPRRHAAGRARALASSARRRARHRGGRRGVALRLVGFLGPGASLFAPCDRALGPPR